MCQHIWKTFATPYNNCFWSLQSLFVSSEVVCYVFRCKDFCQFVFLPKQPAPPAGPPLPKAMPRPPVNVPWPVECTVWSEHAHICPGMCSSKTPSLSGNYLKLKHAGHEHTISTFIFWNFSQSCHLRRWQRLQELQLPLGDHWPLDFPSVKTAWSYDCAHFPMLMWIKKSFLMYHEHVTHLHSLISCQACGSGSWFKINCNTHGFFYTFVLVCSF